MTNKEYRTTLEEQRQIMESEHERLFEAVTESIGNILALLGHDEGNYDLKTIESIGIIESPEQRLNAFLIVLLSSNRKILMNIDEWVTNAYNANQDIKLPTRMYAELAYEVANEIAELTGNMEGNIYKACLYYAEQIVDKSMKALKLYEDTMSLSVAV